MNAKEMIDEAGIAFFSFLPILKREGSPPHRPDTVDFKVKDILYSIAATF